MDSSASTLTSDNILDELTRVTGMAEVEALVRSKFISETRVMTQIPSYLLGLGGKRLRPILTLRCGELFSSAPTPSESLITIAAGIELIHMATLLHDDIVDNSDVRRQQPSPLAKFGMAETLIAGDFLLTRAFSLCSRLDRVIIDATESACISLTEGEAEEFAIPLSAHSEASTIRIARKKTAALFRLGAFSAAFLAGASQEEQENLACFGESLGIAFQILDDILDIIGNEAVFGKKNGTDIRERKPSLVNVLWLASGDKLAEQILLGPPPSDLAIQEAVNYLKDSQVIIKAREIANQYGEKASRALTSINQKGTNLAVRASLNNLISFTLARLQ